METKWHVRPVIEILQELDSTERGLSGAEAKRRLEEYGPNTLPETRAENVFMIFIRQFQSPLIYILVIAAAVVLLMGETVDGAVIILVLVFNAIVGAIQEGKAQNTIQALKRFVETTAVTIRDGEEIIIPDTEVVSGDIIVLQEGGKIPADARLIEDHNLKIDEAALTGESEAVRKTAEVMNNPDATFIEQKNMVFKGTHVVIGNGRATVVATGVETMVGRIAKEISSIDTEIPLKANIRHLSRLIIIATMIIITVIFSLGIIYGNSVREMFATAVSLAVSVIPSGLPIALTLVLATGVWRMSKRNALVKRLQAVEALGQARVIAVDKTGTITKNEMVIQEIYTGGKFYNIGGVGYEPTGSFSLAGATINPPDHPELLAAGRVASFCANARTMYSEEIKGWRVSGDPTEAAMFVLGKKLGFNKDDLERESPLLSETPFDYKLKYHVTLHQTKEGGLMTLVGAPEVVLMMCTGVMDNGVERLFRQNEKEELEAKFLEMSRRGLRVLAFSTTREVPENLDPSNIRSLVLGGFFGMKDALRPEVQDAARRAMSAGIRVVMITGDHRVTAEALAREALIYEDGDMILSGQEIDEMSDESLYKALARTTVFARVTPDHKLRIINAYKSRGEIVAMTGDGVNDAPSLVAADLGVAMGKIGTEVAKEASDIILLDDNFGSIVSAIEEGRSIYKTIKKVILYLTSTSIGEVLVISGAILLGFPLPLLPAQIIWLNFVTDGFFIPALAMEPKERGLLDGSFEKPRKYLMDGKMVRRMFLMAVPMMIGTLVLFSNYFEADLAKAWTISLTLLAAFQWFNAWNCRSEDLSVFRQNPFSNKYLVGGTVVAIICQLFAVYHPFFQKFLRTVPLDFQDWLLIIVFSSSILVLEEARKLIPWQRKKFWSLSDKQLLANQPSA